MPHTHWIPRAFLSLAAALLVLGGLATNASAAVIVSGEGSEGLIFSVNGNVTVIVGSSGFTFGDEINVNVDTASSMDVNLQAADWSDVDARFALSLDGDVLTPTETSDIGEPFFATYDDIALSMGDHRLTVTQTHGAMGSFDVDVATYSISVAADDSAPSPVPEPATLILLGTGLVGMVGFHRRRRKNIKNSAPKSE